MNMVDRHISPWRHGLDAVPSRISGKEKRVGVDIGGVLCIHKKDMINSTNSWWLDAEMAVPDAMKCLKRLVETIGPNNVFIISKAKWKMQRHLETWLFHTMDICVQTGILRDNIVFCTQRSGSNGKGIQAKALRLTHFVDDTLDCLESIHGDPFGNSREHVDAQDGKLVLFARSGMGKSRPYVPDRLPSHVFETAANWNDAINIFLNIRKKVRWGTEDSISAQEHSQGVVVRSSQWPACSSPGQAPTKELTSEEECEEKDAATHWHIEQEYEDMGIAQQQGTWGIARANLNGWEYGSEYLHLRAGDQVFIPSAAVDEGWLHVWSNRLGEYGWVPPQFVETRD